MTSGNLPWKKIRNSGIFLILSAFLIFIGGKGLIWVVTDTFSILQSKNWEMVSGTTTQIGINTTHDYGRFAAHTQYSPEIKYSFVVGGQTYQGNRFSIPKRRTTSLEEAQRQIAPYEINSDVAIYYDTKNPNKSVVQKPYFDYFFTFFLGIFSPVMLVGGWFAFRRGIANLFFNHKINLR